MSLTNSLGPVTQNQDNSNASASSHHSDDHVMASPQQDHVRRLFISKNLAFESSEQEHI